MALIGDMQYLTIGSKTYRIASSSLPIASASTLGGIKVGTGLTIDSTTGVLSATGTDVTIDNAVSGTSTNPVQNKVIKEYVDGLVAGVLHYKGTKATTAALPSSGNITGDVWHVTQDGGEYAWDGSTWQELGTATDLSGYMASADYPDLTAIEGISATSGLLKKTAANTWTLDTSSYLTSYTETDPVFSASVASGITSTDIANWNGKTSNIGTVTNVELNNATNGGLSINGSPITSSGTITVGHSNILNSAQTTSGIYPIKIDKNGHISEYGSAVTIPTKVSDLTNDSGFISTYTDEKMKWTASTSSNTYYPLQSTSTATTSTANTLNGINFYQYYNTAGGYRQLNLGNATAYKSTGGAYGSIRLYGAAATYYGDLVPGTLGTTSGDGHISANRTWTLPDKTGTIALTSDIPTIPTNVSVFTNDAGYLTSYTETDPTVPSWAKESTKPSYTASQVGAATDDHVHGNITNSGDITATAPTIASGDKLIINDQSTSKITNGPSFGTNTTQYLANNGTWQNVPDISGKIDTAGTGLSKSGTTLNHSNSVIAQTTQAVYPIKIDAQGHISDYGSAVIISDTKVTQSAAITTAGQYPVILGYNTGTSEVTNTVNKSANLTYNPNTKELTNAGGITCGSLDDNYGLNDSALLYQSTMDKWKLILGIEDQEE